MLKASKLFKGFFRDFKPVIGEGFKSRRRQFFEVLQLILRCQYTPKEYYRYKFYEADKDYGYMLNYLPNYYLNKNFRPALNNSEWTHVFRNKLLFNKYYRQFDIPVTNIYGFYDGNSGLTAEGTPLTNPAELKEYLLAIKPTSLVIKPIGGDGGKNIIVIDQVVCHGNDIRLFSNCDGVIDYKEIEDFLLINSKANKYPGYLFEENVSQHELLNQFNSSSLNTLRIMTLLNENNVASIKLSMVKFGRIGCRTDNTAQGGLYAKIDPETGYLGHGVGGLSYQGKVFYEHPDSKINFDGFQVPYWDEVVKLCTEAARLAPFCRAIGWDVGINPDGPVFIEGNDKHSMESQILFHGYLQNDTREELAQFGLNYPEGNLPPLKMSMFYDAVKVWSNKKKI